MAKKALDITGQKFGKLVALNRSTTDKTKWLFQCDCETRDEVLPERSGLFPVGLLRDVTCFNPEKLLLFESP